jgi:hypothetical protein
MRRQPEAQVNSETENQPRFDDDPSSDAIERTEDAGEESIPTAMPNKSSAIKRHYPLQP